MLRVDRLVQSMCMIVIRDVALRADHCVVTDRDAETRIDHRHAIDINSATDLNARAGGSLSYCQKHHAIIEGGLLTELNVPGVLRHANPVQPTAAPNSCAE